VNEMLDGIIRTSECVTNETLTNTWPEIEYRFDRCCATNCAHIAICRARKKLCEVQCLKMYQFLIHFMIEDA